MDYSLLIGIHDCRLAAEDADGNKSDAHSDSEDCDSGERQVDSLFNFLTYLPCDSFRWENTPPDSPRQLDMQAINPEADIYAVPSREGLLILTLLI